MKDIAREAGVTTSTVSLVFRRKPEVSAATREKIIGIAKRLGYRTDPYVSTLMSNRKKGKLPASSPVLAFATAYATADGWRHHSETFVSYYEGARARTAEKGFRLEVFWLGRRGSLGRRASKIFYTRNISGILLAPLPDNLTSINLEWHRFSSVALGFSITQPILTRVASDHLQSVTLAMRRCHSLGYRRMGLVLTKANHERIDRRWLAAFLLAQKRLSGVEMVQPLVINGFYDDYLPAWLQRERPDVVIGHYSDGLMQQRLIASGRRVPQDIGLVELNCPTRDGTVSGVFENPTQLGVRAIDLLVGGINRNERGIPTHRTTLLVDGLWVPGKTLRNDLSTDVPKQKVQSEEYPHDIRRVSMKDIAIRTGLSPATISLALQGSSRIPESTRARARMAAEELGYRKNLYLSELMKHKRSGKLPSRRPVLGFVTGFATRAGWKKTTPLFYQYLLGARRRASSLGFELKEIWLLDPDLPPDPSEVLRRDGLQGLLFAPFPRAETNLSLRWNYFCLVGFGFTLHNISMYRVISETYSSILLAIEQCKALGYRRIGFCLSADSDSRVQSRWTSAYGMHQREHPEKLLPDILLLDQWNKETFRGWIDREQPDVVIAPSTEQFHRWLSDSGLSAPRDIGLVSLNAPTKQPWFTGIDQNGELVGSRAVDVLVGLLERNEYGITQQPNTLFIDGTWNPGQSVRHPRDQPQLSAPLATPHSESSFPGKEKNERA